MSVLFVPTVWTPAVTLLQFTEFKPFVFCCRTKLLAVAGHDTITMLFERVIVSRGRSDTTSKVTGPAIDSILKPVPENISNSLNSVISGSIENGSGLTTG